jgi:hypothetical protein
MNRILSGTALAATLMTPAMAQDAFVLDDIVFSVGLTALEAARAGVVVSVIEEEDLRAAGEVPLPYLPRHRSRASASPATGHPGPARPCASAGRGRA